MDKTRAIYLVKRFEEWIDYTEREMRYLKKSVDEIKKELKAMK